MGKAVTEPCVKCRRDTSSDLRVFDVDFIEGNEVDRVWEEDITSVRLCFPCGNALRESLTVVRIVAPLSEPIGGQLHLVSSTPGVRVDATVDGLPLDEHNRRAEQRRQVFEKLGIDAHCRICGCTTVVEVSTVQAVYHHHKDVARALHSHDGDGLPMAPNPARIFLFKCETCSKAWAIVRA